MAVRIRLARVGATKRPSYRVVAIDSRKPRDGRALEILGFYDPLTDPATVRLEGERIREWIGKGAKPSETVVKLLRQAGMDARGEEAAAVAVRSSWGTIVSSRNGAKIDSAGFSSQSDMGFIGPPPIAVPVRRHKPMPVE